MRSMKVEHGDELVVTFLDGNIDDGARIMEIGDDLNEIASRTPPRETIVLDLQNVELTSAMVGLLVRLRRATEIDEIELRLRHVSPTVCEILRSMKLDHAFHVEGSADSTPGQSG